MPATIFRDATVVNLLPVVSILLRGQTILEGSLWPVIPLMVQWCQISRASRDCYVMRSPHEFVGR